jgi:D-3-phosphoglycerate dehydrogenase
VVAGTIIGKATSRWSRSTISDLELVPEGHILADFQPGPARCHRRYRNHLGRHDINIGRMHVGQEKDGDHNIIFLQTDTPVPPDVLEELRSAELVSSVTPLEL